MTSNTPASLKTGPAPIIPLKPGSCPKGLAQGFFGDSRLADASHTFQTDGLTLHYIDTGPGVLEKTMLCLHPKLGWSYAFRKIIPILVEEGYRVVAVDLPGFGLSSKPHDLERLNISAQVNRLVALIQHLDLGTSCILGHEMGAGIATQLPRLLPGQICGLILANPAARLSHEGWPGLHMWQSLIRMSGDIDFIAELSDSGAPLSFEEQAAYRHPLQDAAGKRALDHFHQTVIIGPDHSDYDFVVAGYNWLKTEWTGDAMIMVGEREPLFGLSSAQQLADLIGYQRRPTVLNGTGSRIFEDNPDCIRQAIDRVDCRKRRHHETCSKK